MAVVMMTPSDSSSPAPQNLSTSEYWHELSCTAIMELPDDIISTLLNLGTTSHLVTNWEYFINFQAKDNPGIQTANHGTLCTTGRGMCVTDLTLTGEKYRATLHNCLCTPGVLTKLLSVRCMLEEGWNREFKGSCNGKSARCQFSYDGKVLGDLPLIGNLCHMKLYFIHPSKLFSQSLVIQEISAVAKSTATLDLWHARMGHPGGKSVKHLPLVTTGVNVNCSKPLSQCEVCIMAKHPCKPYPPSKTLCTQDMLDLVHSDLCGPFPI